MAIELGKINTLTIKRAVDFGLYIGPEDSDEEILMPRRYTSREMRIGDLVDVFVYNDSEDRLVATTEKPKAMVGEFALLRVKSISKVGAFLDWGLMKDLFCPFREQKMKMVRGNSYIVHIHLDKESYRIMASAKVERYLSEETPDYRHGQEVDLLVWQKTDLGFKVIIDNKYGGLVYKDQIFKYIHTGDRMKGYIGTVRPDGKIDVTLQPTGKKLSREFSDALLDYLKENNGYCNLGDKSNAEDIYDRFQVSKKTFKKAIGDLYKRHIITLEEGGMGIVLVEK